MNCNTNLLVKNENGTSRLPLCTCITRLNHYRSNGGGGRSTCSRIGCSGSADVGAHVKMVDHRRSRASWIVPLCRGCNHPSNQASMFIDSRTALVRANKALTCDLC
jgi:hypothetical protein